MITINKIEYIMKDTPLEGQLNGYIFARPWLKIYTSKGEIEFPLSNDYDEKFYADKLQSLAKLASGAKINMSYDFRDNEE